MPESAGFYEPFDGDGRTKVVPAVSFKSSQPHAQPASITRSAARLLIDRFIKNGETTHSKAGNTVWVIEAWAQRQGVEIKIVKHPFGGYWIQLLQQEDELPEPEPEQVRIPS